MTISGLDLVANSGDERLATKHYRAVNAYEELLTALITAKARLQVAGLGVKDIERAIDKAEGL